IVFAYDESAYAGDEIFVPEVPEGDPYALPEGGGEAIPVFGDRPLDGPEATGDPVAAGERDAAAPGEAGEIAVDTEISGLDTDLADIPLRGRIELTRLPPEAWTMDGIWERLVALDAYHPIMRTAWTQATPPQAASPSIRLRALGDPPPGLDGTVTLYQGRFVHLGLDLTLDAAFDPRRVADASDPGRAATDRAIAASGLPDEPAFGDARSLQPAFPVRYRIAEDRILRDGEIRYYDHPRFGVIAKLTRVQEPPASPLP